MEAREPGLSGIVCSTSGAVAVLTALLLPVLIGIAAWAIDASLLLYRQERLQIAADIAAHAGAELLRKGGTEAQAIAFARRMAEENAGARAGTLPEVTVTVPEPARLEVDASLAVERLLSRLFGQGDSRVWARAVAVFDASAPAGTCLHLDDPRAQRALRLRNDSSLTLDGCGVAVASDHGRAVVLMRDARLQASCLDVTGGISGSAQITLTQCTEPRTGVSVPPPVVTAPPRPTGPCEDSRDDDKERKDKKDKKGKGDDDGGEAPEDRLQPVAHHPSGLAQIRFCGGLEIDRDTTGGAGLYFISGGDLEIEKGATLDLGPGAVIVLMDDAEITMDDDARLRIVAPDSGPLDGVAVIAGHDRETHKTLKHDLGVPEIAGELLLPGEEIAIAGQGGDPHCTRIVAGRLEMGRDARLNIRCKNGAGTTAGQVRLLPDE